MGQCEVCTNEMEYNNIDYDFILKEISSTDLAQDIQKLRSDNEEYIKQSKTITFPNNVFFKGKTTDSNKEGYGEFYCIDFNFYGHFKNDLPHGTGALITQSQCLYGEFEHGLLNGQGKQWTQKYQFNGLYRSGQRIEGSLMRDELTYTGPFHNNLYEGKGTLHLKDGTSYIGMFKEGKFDGQGILTFENGNTYRGRFKQGKYDGYGQFLWKNGNYYKGEYTHGERNGYGVLLLGGVQYAGQWKNGVRQGRGILSTDNDQVFGDWKDNMLLEK